MTSSHTVSKMHLGFFPLRTELQLWEPRRKGGVGAEASYVLFFWRVLAACPPWRAHARKPRSVGHLPAPRPRLPLPLAGESACSLACPRVRSRNAAVGSAVRIPPFSGTRHALLGLLSSCCVLMDEFWETCNYCWLEFIQFLGMDSGLFSAKVSLNTVW